MTLGVVLALSVVASTANAGGIQGEATGYFHTQRIGDRWFMVDPTGNAMITRGLSVTGAPYGSWSNTGDFKQYDTIYLSNGPDASNFSGNLTAQGASSIPYNHDVIHPATGRTVQKVGDAIYIGWRLPVTCSSFWLDGQLATGGKITWYYSIAGGWAPINGTGKPYSGYNNGDYRAGQLTLNSDLSYYFDVGGATAPEENGTDQPDPDYSNNRNPAADRANHIHWWATATGLPTNFAPAALRAENGTLVDATPLYYIKGVVTQNFTTAPALNRLYERDYSYDVAMRKYGIGHSLADAFVRAKTSMTGRLQALGINAEGSYSNNQTALPTMVQWQLSGRALDPPPGAHVHDIWQAPVCPPRSGLHLAWWSSKQMDVFAANAPSAFLNAAATYYGQLPQNWRTKVYSIATEEPDWMTGFQNGSPHVGIMVLLQNPYNTVDPFNQATYADPLVYSRLALRDYLRYVYKDSGDPVAPALPSSTYPINVYSQHPTGFELSALNRLNRAWGTSYTSWDTSSGNLRTGTNAWGAGTGFMDEDGTHVLNGAHACSHLQYTDDSGIKAGVLADLNNYDVLFAARYAYMLSQAMNQQAHPPVFVPLYTAPASVFRAMAPAVDGFWVNAEAADVQALYDNAHKPVIEADYLSADMDSPAAFGGHVVSSYAHTIDGSTFTHVQFTEYPYTLSPSYWVQFADQATQTCLTQHHLRWAYIPFSSFGWDFVEMSGGDFTPCLTTNSRIEPDEGGSETQPDHAAAMINRWDSVATLKGTDDQSYFVIGLDKWALFDDASSVIEEIGNKGIMTAGGDNMYDGVEARRAVHSVTYPGGIGTVLVGGEDRDYGNLLTQPVATNTSFGTISLANYWRTFDHPTTNLSVHPIPGTPNGVTVTRVSGGTVSLQWQANPHWDQVTGYTVYSAPFSMVYFTAAQIRANPGIARTHVANTSAQVAVPPNTWGFFRVTASNAGGESDFSMEVAANGLQAIFTFSPSNPVVNQPVQFTDTSTGGPTSWSWNFGDTHTSTLENPSHMYTATGTYTVKLTVSNSSGQSQTSQNVRVRAGAGNEFNTLAPCRVFDTRIIVNGIVGSPLQPYETRSFEVGGVCGIPADAVAISANVTVTDVGALGELVVFPADVMRPNTSTLSFRTGRTRANNALVSFSKSSATFSVFNNSAATVDLIFDVNGFFR